MVLRLLEKGIDVVTYNRSREKTKDLIGDVENEIQKSGIPLISRGRLYPEYDIPKLVSQIAKPRIIWLMVEHGKPVDMVIKSLIESGVQEGDVIIDGGNSFYTDSIRRHDRLKKKGIHFLDVGTSGGLEGARDGACLMIGGDEEVFIHLKDFFASLSTAGGFEYFGPSGSGHFVKMVHNGVEYGMLQAIGEGFELLAKSPFPLDLSHVAHNWSHGSVVRGWLMDLLTRALKTNPGLSNISGSVGGGSTGEWSVKTAKKYKVDAPVIKASLSARKKSVAKPTFSGKIVSSLRHEFGGHS